jgi:hypothetical protein
VKSVEQITVAMRADLATALRKVLEGDEYPSASEIVCADGMSILPRARNIAAILVSEAE